MATSSVRSIALPTDALNEAEARLYADLAALGIEYAMHEHPPVFTVEESSQHTQHIKGVHTKNLFLKDKAGAFWLVTVPDQARVDLKALPAAIGCGRVSFGKAEDMQRLLGITPGSVTALAAINDVTGSVRVVLDADLAKAAIINCHPLRNNATVSLPATDLIRALTHWQHPPTIAIIPTLDPV
jgi:Ala-tRNA(Pro) deacylase